VGERRDLSLRFSLSFLFLWRGLSWARALHCWGEGATTVKSSIFFEAAPTLEDLTQGRFPLSAGGQPAAGR